MQDPWNRIGIDTLHVSYKTQGGLRSGDVVLGLAELLDEIGLDGDFIQRDRGRHGFENGITFGKLLELDWTDVEGEGPNKGTASAQFKGEFFSGLGAAEVAVMGLLVAEIGPHKCTRIDAQVTAQNCPLAESLIADFRAGRLACPRKKYFEPKGQELEGGHYPKGATLCLGSRQSNVFCRAYDKHLQKNDGGPQRLRAEVELKGPVAIEAWKAYLAAWKHEALTLPAQLTEEVKLSQRLVRTYMPLRDVTQWAPGQRPKDWAGKAPEPSWWAELFEAKAERLRVTKEPSKELRVALGRSRKQAGGRYLQDLILAEVDLLRSNEADPEHSHDQALRLTRSRMARHASDQRLQELLENLPPEFHAFARSRWTELGKIGGDDLDDELEIWGNGVNPPM